jgi:hypothetical protein
VGRVCTNIYCYIAVCASAHRLGARGVCILSLSLPPPSARAPCAAHIDSVQTKSETKPPTPNQIHERQERGLRVRIAQAQVGALLRLQHVTVPGILTQFRLFTR